MSLIRRLLVPAHIAVAAGVLPYCLAEPSHASLRVTEPITEFSRGQQLFLDTADGLLKEADASGRILAAICTQPSGDSDPLVRCALLPDNGDVVTYLFTNNMKHGEFFCQGTTEDLVVTGKMVKKDGKKMITATSVEKKS